MVIDNGWMVDCLPALMVLISWSNVYLFLFAIGECKKKGLHTSYSLVDFTMNIFLINYTQRIYVGIPHISLTTDLSVLICNVYNTILQ